jgi:hypothetical protein
LGLRAAIANNITPYYHPRIGVTIAPRFAEVRIEVPNFPTVEEAESFLNILTSMVGSGDLSLSTALDLSTLVRNWISAKHQAAELELKRLQADVSDQPQIIRIEGGLPQLPGTNVTMPGHLNGHDAIQGPAPRTHEPQQAKDPEP